jgi:hypothetical protein
MFDVSFYENGKTVHEPVNVLLQVWLRVKEEQEAIHAELYRQDAAAVLRIISVDGFENEPEAYDYDTDSDIPELQDDAEEHQQEENKEDEAEYDNEEEYEEEHEQEHEEENEEQDPRAEVEAKADNNNDEIRYSDSDLDLDEYDPDEDDSIEMQQALLRSINLPVLPPSPQQRPLDYGALPSFADDIVMEEMPSLEAVDNYQLTDDDYLLLAALNNNSIVHYQSDTISMAGVVEHQVVGNEHTLARVNAAGDMQIDVVTRPPDGHSPRLFSQSRSANDDTSGSQLRRRNPRN